MTMSDMEKVIIDFIKENFIMGRSAVVLDPAQYLISTAALPIASRVVEASKERPYLGIVLKLDSTLVGSVLVETGHRAPRNATAATAIDVSALDASLLDAVVRLVRLLDSPAEAVSYTHLTLPTIYPV